MLPHAFFRTVQAAILLSLAIAAPAHAGGYWKCEQGAWTAIGSPTHEKPVKACGETLAIPRDEANCLSAGGTWGRAGIFPAPICRVPTTDGGRVCADTDECEGYCLAKPTPAQMDQITARNKLEILGTCTPYHPSFGCMAVVREGYVSGILCRD
jgi:hypothetical protein